MQSKQSDTILKKFKLQPEDNLIRKLGTSNASFEENLWELVNNAIQAAGDNDLNFLCDIKFEFDEENPTLIKKLSVTDKSGGICINDIQNCLNPGYIHSSEITLSEHGMGLNVALEHINREAEKYKLTSYHKEQNYYIEDTLSWQTACEVKKLSEVTNFNGLSIEFFNLSNNFGYEWPEQNNRAEFYKFWATTCAKYRFQHQKFVESGKMFHINFIATCGVKKRERIYVPLKPILQNPLDGKDAWITQFTLKDDLGNEVSYSLGSSDVNRVKYSIPAGEHTVFYHIHPYRITGKIYGFDTIYQDVVIKFNSTDEVFKDSNSSGGNWALYSGLRGEKRIIKGGSSVFTKNALTADDSMRKLDDLATAIFLGKEPHPNTGMNTNYVEKYVHRRNTTKNNCAPEIIVKYRHRKALEMVGGSIVTQEETTMCGNIDMVVDKIKIMEHKTKKTTADDVMQLLKYMLAKPDIKFGELWAPEHTDQTKDMLDKVNALIASNGQKLELKILLDQWKNPNLNDKEKEILNGGTIG